MSEAAIKKAIEERLLAVWGATSEIAWDDVEFKPTTGTPFIEPKYTCVLSKNIAIGCERNFYLLSVMVNTKAGQGGLLNAQLADQIKNNFINRTIDGVTYLNGRIERRPSKNEWYRKEVLIDFFHDNKF